MAGTITLDDIGTRYRHYSELLELYECGLEAVRRSVNTTENQQREKDLTVAITLLRTQLTVLGDYTDSKWLLSKQIDLIPTADHIQGGRGTPLITMNKEQYGLEHRR